SHIAGSSDHLGAVIHPDGETTTEVVLEMWRLAAVGTGDRLDVVGPLPARLEGQPADLGAPHRDDLGLAVREVAPLVRAPEALVLGLVLHVGSSSVQFAMA